MQHVLNTVNFVHRAWVCVWLIVHIPILPTYGVNLEILTFLTLKTDQITPVATAAQGNTPTYIDSFLLTYFDYCKWW